MARGNEAAPARRPPPREPVARHGRELSDRGPPLRRTRGPAPVRAVKKSRGIFVPTISCDSSFVTGWRVVTRREVPPGGGHHAFPPWRLHTRRVSFPPPPAIFAPWSPAVRAEPSILEAQETSSGPPVFSMEMNSTHGIIKRRPRSDVNQGWEGDGGDPSPLCSCCRAHHDQGHRGTSRFSTLFSSEHRIPASDAHPPAVLGTREPQSSHSLVESEVA